MRESLLLCCLVYITTLLSSVRAFSVTFGAPSQCDPFTVSWAGGQEPFEILLTPRSSPLVNQSVPSSAFTNGKGSYTIPELPLVNGTQFALTMSDGTGFGSGGTTTLLTVDPPVQNNNCNTTLSQDFCFSLPSQLKQCAYFNFTDYTDAIQPVTIGILILGGVPTEFSPPNGSYYSWMADIVEGTSLLFFMVDSQGRQGGVSDLEVVADSTDFSCLGANLPSSTASIASTPTSSQSILASSGSTSNTGVIAGATVGSVAFVALLTILGIYWRRRVRPPTPPLTIMPWPPSPHPSPPIITPRPRPPRPSPPTITPWPPSPRLSPPTITSWPPSLRPSPPTIMPRPPPPHPSLPTITPRPPSPRPSSPTNTPRLPLPCPSPPTITPRPPPPRPSPFTITPRPPPPRPSPSTIMPRPPPPCSSPPTPQLECSQMQPSGHVHDQVVFAGYRYTGPSSSYSRPSHNASGRDRQIRLHYEIVAVEHTSYHMT